jgi:toxin ParE1/3/4
MPCFYLTKNAQASLEDIARYTENEWGRAQRNKYILALDKRFQDLANFPLKGRVRDELFRNLRSYSEGQHIVFYLESNDSIVIVDILHERMDPAQHLIPPYML